MFPIDMCSLFGLMVWATSDCAIRSCTWLHNCIRSHFGSSVFGCRGFPATVSFNTFFLCIAEASLQFKQNMDNLMDILIDSKQALRPVLSKISESVDLDKEAIVKRAHHKLHENDDIDTMYCLPVRFVQGFFFYVIWWTPSIVFFCVEIIIA